MEHSGQSDRRGFFSSRANIALIGFLLIAGYFLVTEHRAHLYLALPYLPWLLLLACPLLHVFMHGGHGGHGGGDDTSAGQNPPPHQH
jgi:Protein of unknown function (DUF2933)